MHDRVIEEKFDSLIRCLERVRARTPASIDALSQNVDAQDILSLNLERAVQLSVDVALHLLSETNARPPESMADAFAGLAALGILQAATAERMMKAVGFRNLSVHAYRLINWAIVYKIATDHLVDFRAFMSEIAAHSG